MTGTNDPHEFDDLIERLDAAAGEEEAILREASEMADAPGSDRVLATLEREWGEPSREASPALRRRPFLFALAAAAIVAVFLWPRGEAPDPVGPGDTLLNSDKRGSLIEPAEGDPLGSRVSWTAPAGAESAQFLVRLRTPGPATDTLYTGHADGTTHTFENLDLEALPDRVVLEIEPQIPGGTRLVIRTILPTP